jgi:hypothetical protein
MEKTLLREWKMRPMTAAVKSEKPRSLMRRPDIPCDTAWVVERRRGG